GEKLSVYLRRAVLGASLRRRSCASTLRRWADHVTTQGCAFPLCIGAHLIAAGREVFGEGVPSHGSTSRVSRAQVCVWSTAPHLTHARSAHANRTGLPDRREPSQCPELGDRRVVSQIRDTATPDRGLAGPGRVHSRPGSGGSGPALGA